MKELKPTPFEIAALAALLSLRDEKAKSTPVENWFGSAERLLALARAHISRPTNEEINAGVMANLRLTLFTFDQVLKLTNPPHGRNKKGTSMVGAITTSKGLQKAIRRALPERADKILADKKLMQVEIDAIIEDQARRNRLKRGISQ